MRRFAAALALAVLSLAMGSVTIAQSSDTIDPTLRAMLREAGAEEMIPAYAVFNPWLDVNEILPVVEGMLPDARRKYVCDLLQKTAATAQGTARSFLRAEESLGHVTDIAVIWLNNTLAFRATPAVILGMAEFANVRAIRYDIQTTPEETCDAAPPGTPSAGLNLLNAPAAWALGYQGQGIIVANVDTGCNYNHPDMVSHVWNNSGEIPANGIDDDTNGYVDDIVGWNFSANSNNPIETGSGSHGSQVGGIICGDGTQGTATGVAPLATQMVLKLGSGQTSWWLSYQYAANNGARVTASSNSLKWPSSPDYPGFRQASDMELAIGVIHTNSIGNQGPGSSTYPIPFNIAAPGCCPPPWIHPSQTLAGGISSTMGCGAVDANSASLMSYSGRGPFAWNLADVQALNPGYSYTWPAAFNDYPYVGGSMMGLLKPDVCCPTNTPSTSGTGSGYTSSFTGTSCATPHLGGCATVILSVNPTLTPAAVCQILQTTAIDQGAPGKDNDYGAGRVNLLAAVTLAQTFSGAGPLADLSFEAQTAGAAPAGEWSNGAIGSGNVAGPSGGCTSVAGMPFGNRFMIVSAAGSNAALPPAGAAGPIGAASVEQAFQFNPQNPNLRIEMAFENAHNAATPATNDFACATVTDGATSATIILMDTLTPTVGPGCAGGLITARATGMINLAAAFPSATSATALTLVLSCGNGGNGVLSSRAYFDNIRLLGTGFKLALADSGTGDVTLDVTGAGAGAELFNLFSTALATPTGSGIFLGFNPAGSPQLFTEIGMPLGAAPVHVLADASGRYAFLLPNGLLPPSLQLDARTVAIAGGLVTLSNAVTNTW